MTFQTVADVKSGSSVYLPMLEEAMVRQATIPFSDVNGENGRAALWDTLTVHGFAIVTDVLSAEEVTQREQDFANDLVSIIDVQNSRESAARNILLDPVKQWPDSLSLGKKFAALHGLPQGTAAWGVRTSPRVKRVYEVMFDSDELVVGTDCVFFSNKKAEHRMDNLRRTDLWPHADQNSNISPSGEWQSVQGVVYLWPADIDTSATVVWPGSHTEVYGELMRTTGSRGHFCRLEEHRLTDFVNGARRVPVPSGAMLLWNSRTIHQGWPHGPRLAVPVCFEPRERRSEQALKSKRTCVVEGHPTSHWASLGKKHSLSSNKEDDGTDDVRLVRRAHLHVFTEEGGIRPVIDGLL